MPNKFGGYGAGKVIGKIYCLIKNIGFVYDLGGRSFVPSFKAVCYEDVRHLIVHPVNIENYGR